jgi:hypothetical protein
MPARARRAGRGSHLEQDRTVIAELCATLAALVIAGGAVAAREQPAPERLRFEVAPGKVLARNLYLTHELSVESMGQTLDGGPFRPERVAGSISTWHKVTVDDEILEVSDGRPTRLRRTFTDLGGGGKLRFGPQKGPRTREEEAVLTSPMTHRAVDLLWIPEEGTWSRCWSVREADEVWLQGLDGDADMLALLPPGEVAVGESWEIPLTAVRVLLAPGGNTLITPRTRNVFSRSVEVGVGGDFSEILGAELSGRFSARLAEVREEGAARVARVELSLEGVHGVADRTELWRTSMPIEEKREKARLIGAFVEHTLDAQGELLWDLTAGHLRSVGLNGRQRFVSTLSKDLAGAQGPTRMDAQSTFTGALSFSYTVEERAAAQGDK